MKKGELAFFYHSNCKIPGIAGIMEIVEEATVDSKCCGVNTLFHPGVKCSHIRRQLSRATRWLATGTAFETKHPYFDAKSDSDKPRWFNVHVGFKQKLPRHISLKELQSHKGPGQALENMQLLKQSRLSVGKVSESEWKFILGLLEEEAQTQPGTAAWFFHLRLGSKTPRMAQLMAFND